MTGADLLEPHLIAAGVLALIAAAMVGYYYWRYLTGVAGDD
ncbi:MAG TPA: hypothetical protein VM760_08885 [Sphingomicrobium sp.]|nr:hypothetical protein [Sphingomicrobium sp.]